MQTTKTDLETSSMNPSHSADNSSSETLGNRNSSRWQFTLRETLLATLAFAGIFAAFFQYQPRQSSAMARSFNALDVVNTVIENQKLAGSARGLGGSGGGYSPQLVMLDSKIAIDEMDSPTINNVLMPALMSELERSVKAEGFKTQEPSTTGRSVSNQSSISGFSFVYEGQSITGHLRVFSINDNGDQPILVITLNEF